MGKIYVQKMPAVLSSTASLASSASISGSLVCDGYSVLIGGVYSSASGKAASSLVIEQSFDEGTNWDLVTACATVSELTSSSRKDDIIGNAVRVTYRNGADAASVFRVHWMVRPI